MTFYPYTDRDLLAVREAYQYSALQGPPFLPAYIASRRAALAALPAQNGPVLQNDPATIAKPRLPSGDGRIDTAQLLAALAASPDTGWIDRLVHRFEVSKRLAPSYDVSLRNPEGRVDDLTLYAGFAVLLRRDSADTLVWLNALLKVNDLLLSQPRGAQAPVADLIRRAVAHELGWVTDLQRAVAVQDA